MTEDKQTERVCPVCGRETKKPLWCAISHLGDGRYKKQIRFIPKK